MSGDPAPRWRDRGEHGAAAVFVAIASTLLLVMAAFAVDLGMQRVLRRDMQALADVVALDLARHVDGRSHAVIKATNEWRGQLQDSVARNLEVEAAEVSVQQDGERVVATVAGEDTAVTATLGEIRDGEFVVVPYPDVPSAVRVATRSTVDFGFARVVGVDEGAAGATAVGTRGVPTVCFGVGTRTLTLDTSTGQLSPLLDHVLRVNLSAVGYSGLADVAGVSVPLAGLFAELNIGDRDAVASTNISLGPLLVAAADLLRAAGHTAEAQLLELVELGVPGVEFPLGRILTLATGTDVSGLDVEVPLLDLLGAAVLAANGANAVDLSALGIAKVTIVEPPQVACGGPGTTGHSAQVRALVNAELPGSPEHQLLGGAVGVLVEVGRGTATVDGDLLCNPDRVPLTATSGAVALLPPEGKDHQVRLDLAPGVITDYLDPVTAWLVQGLGLSRVSLEVLLEAGIASNGPVHQVVTYPDEGPLPTVVLPDSPLASALHISDLDVEFGAGQDTLLGVLGLLLNPLLSTLVTAVVQPLVNEVVDEVLKGLLTLVSELLGIRLGVAEIDMLSRPDCASVRLTD